MLLYSGLLSALLFLRPTTALPTTAIKRNNDEGPSVGKILDDDTRAWLADAARNSGVTGMSIAVVTPEGEGFEFFGVKDVEGNPIAPDTYFSIGSNSKWVTSLAIATLETYHITMANGEVFSLDSRMKDVYPNFRMVDDSATEQVTVAEMFGMVTGVPRHDFSIGQHDTAFTALDNFASLKPSVPHPSPVQQYSTIHYDALSALPQILVNRTLADFVENDIWKPLGMEATFNATYARETGRLANGFTKTSSNSTACGIDATNNHSLSDACVGRLDAFEYWTMGDGMEQGGGGAIIMTPKDMLKWSKESMDPQVIPRAALESATHRYDFLVSNATETLPKLTYGMGVNKRVQEGVEILWHGGAVPGHNSNFHRSIDKGYSIFLVVNEDLSYNFAQNYGRALLERLIGQEGVNKDPVELERRDLAAAAEGAKWVEAFNVTDFMAKRRDPPSPDAIASKRYTGPGYPDLVIRPLDLTDSDAIEAAGINPDTILLTLNQTVGPIITTTDNTAYYAKVEGSFAQRWLFTHWDGPLFNHTIISTFEKIGTLDDGRDAPRPVYDSKHVNKLFGSGSCVFAEGGLGMFGTFWAQDAPQLAVPAVEENVAESAIVFFTAGEEVP